MIARDAKAVFTGTNNRAKTDASSVKIVIGRYVTSRCLQRQNESREKLFGVKDECQEALYAAGHLSTKIPRRGKAPITSLRSYPAFLGLPLTYK